MKSVRIYGKERIMAVLIHGGPGARGEMASVAAELSRYFGVMEVLQSSKSIKGLKDELKAAIGKNGPLVLIGHSWGAWLAYLFAAEYPEYAKKLILVGSGPFDEKYSEGIMKTRLDRLDENDKSKLLKLQAELSVNNEKAKMVAFEDFDALIARTDNFAPLPSELNPLKFDPASYEKIWPEAAQLRKNGSLLQTGYQIKCPVTAIHGDYDPHPADGVRIPLSGIIKNFKFILLKKCGHTPWLERYARDRFYEILKREIEI